MKWNAKQYEQQFQFVPSYGEELLGLLTVKPGSRVIDLGCGNGALTGKLAEAGYDVTGVDASPEMLALARKNHPGIPFILADAASYRPDHPADAVFSNAMMHWVPKARQDTLLQNVAASLRTGGEFVFEMGGRGNNALIHGTLGDLFRERGLEYRMPFYFPSIGEYTPMLERAGMAADFSAQFRRPTPRKSEHAIVDWILMFDREPFGGLPEEEIRSIAAEAEKRLKDRLFQDGVWYLDYVRLRMKARRRPDP
ncbi:MAG: methyltransferase domain-containing protein [Lachnospiraceae bacterium]|jgi:trans-aconitate methyltransferase|nr:methyltransferase domain-containing protein [Lachnospiraceae bacterium]MCI1327727.1 methyltransferase domain-containing protein [Lachnospiraceae bacterium]